MQHRRRQLEAEFQRKVSLRQPLEYEAFVGLMDAKVRGSFDRELARQLWDRAQQEEGRGGETCMLDLIGVIFEAEEILRARMETNRVSLQRYKEERAKSAASLDQLREQEKQNTHGVMEGSTVTVLIREAEVATGEGQFKVLLLLGESKQQTNSRACHSQGDKLFVKWDHQVEFSIETGTELLTVLLQQSRAKKGEQQEQLTHQLVIPVHTLKDQLAHEGWFDLFDGNGQPSQRISLRVQWVHSKVKYLIGVVRRWDDHIKMANDDQADFQEHLEQLELVFQAQQTKLRIEEDKQLLEQRPRVVTGGFVVGGVANCVFRVQFLDLLLLSAMFMLLLNSHVDKRQLLFILGGLMLSQVYELALLVFHLQHLHLQPDLMSDAPGGWVSIASLALSLAMFLYKWLALGVFGQYFQTYSSQYESLYAYQK